MTSIRLCHYVVHS